MGIYGYIWVCTLLNVTVAYFILLYCIVLKCQYVSMLVYQYVSISVYEYVSM